jgi:hypothetical protein
MLTGPVILTQFGLGCRLALLCVSSNRSFFFHRNISLDERFFFLSIIKGPLFLIQTHYLVMIILEIKSIQIIKQPTQKEVHLRVCVYEDGPTN